MAKQNTKPRAVDQEVAAFEAALLRSINQAHDSITARKHTPDQILGRRRGRPIGSKSATPKVATGIRFDADLLAALKQSGQGWQTRVNAIVRKAVLGS
jgi:uncharacterized protein (DUF4415 family)